MARVAAACSPRFASVKASASAATISAPPAASATGRRVRRREKLNSPVRAEKAASSSAVANSAGVA